MERMPSRTNIVHKIQSATQCDIKTAVLYDTSYNLSQEKTNYIQNKKGKGKKKGIEGERRKEEEEQNSPPPS